MKRISAMVENLLSIYTRSHRPRSLHGAARVAADVLMGIDAVTQILKHDPRLLSRPRQLKKVAKDLQTLARGFDKNKYVLHGGKVFIEGYSPPWPSKSFRGMVRANAIDSTKPAAERGGYLSYFVMSITNRCAFRCSHCYTIHTLQKSDVVPLDVLRRTLAHILELGAGIVSFEGGEPLLRFDDLLVLIGDATPRSNPYIATTGHSLTPTRARQLKQHGLVAAQVSLDHYLPENHDAFRRKRGAFNTAVRAVEALGEAEIMPVLSFCATKEILADDGLYRYLDLARDLGVGLIQVLEPIPSGRLLDQEEQFSLSPSEISAIQQFHVKANTDPQFADHPAVSVRAFMEDGELFGCGWGGNQTFYLDGFGNVQPCPFVALSLGNVLEEDIEVIYRRMRSLFPRPVGGFCPAYAVAPELAAAIAEGCPVPAPYEVTKKIVQRLEVRDLPRLFGALAKS